jgi:pimeloyl-ACP methyl ester carboxylesterase
MSTFVLVHGAWQSTGTWDLLVPLLREQGHKIIIPVLRGLGTDQRHLTSEVGLHHHIDDVSIELSKLDEKVVLVGHSYAGMIVSGVVESHPAKVHSLVFMDAFIPEDGQSVLDIVPPEIAAYFRKVAREQGGGWRLPGGAGQLDLWGLKPGAARDFVHARLSDFSLRCFEEPLRLPANRKAAFPGIFISSVAETYPARPFFEPFAKKARASGWQVFGLNTGHDSHVEDTRGVADILLSAAEPE